MSSKKGATRKASINFMEQDDINIVALRKALGRSASRTEIVMRALAFVARVFVTEEGEYVVVVKRHVHGPKLKWRDDFGN